MSGHFHRAGIARRVSEADRDQPLSAVAARLDGGIEGSPPPRIGMSER